MTRARIADAAHGGHVTRPTPADFVALRESGLSIQQLAAHYSAHKKTVRRWLTETGMMPPIPRKGRAVRPVPSDFAEVAPTMTMRALRAHYDTSHNIIVSWIAHSGIQAKPRPAKERPAYTRPALGYIRAPGYANIALTKTYGREDWAADQLRRFYPVYRCDERGKGQHNGKHWRAGNSVLTGPELIERAERKAARVA